MNSASDNYREARKAQRKAERELNRVARVARRRSEIKAKWDGPIALGSAFSEMTAVNSMVNILANNNVLTIGWGKDNEGGKGIQQLNEWVQQGFSSAICKKKLYEGETPSVFVASTTSHLKSAAFVGGLREESSDDGRYRYIISAYALAEPKEKTDENLTFSIHLKGPSGDVRIPLSIDEQGNPIYLWELSSGEERRWVQGSFLTYPFDINPDDEDIPLTTKRYDEVCISFENNNLQRWFPLIKKETTSFCRELDQG